MDGPSAEVAVACPGAKVGATPRDELSEGKDQEVPHVLRPERHTCRPVPELIAGGFFRAAAYTNGFETRIRPSREAAPVQKKTDQNDRRFRPIRCKLSSTRSNLDQAP